MASCDITRIERIALGGVLPQVFEAERDEPRFASSQVMLADLVFERGRTYSINAVSGAGKTSLCSFLYGVRTDYIGSITFDGRDIRSFGIPQWCALRCRNLAYLPQELVLFPTLTAMENVLLKNRLTDFHTEAEIRDMFARLEIDNRADVPAGRLSAGQRQRVAIIRALCQPFDFILLDEPVSHLDAVNNGLCAALVAETASALGAGVIFTSVGNPLHIDTPLIPLTL